MSNDKKARELRKWLRSQDVKWYIHQNEVSPWRVWHFRLDWYQKWQIGKVDAEPKISWQLYRVNGTDLIPVKVPSKCQPVTRVPGL